VSITSIILYVTVSVWLVWLSIADIRKGEVSNWLTVPPLLLAVAWQTVRGKWAVAFLFALVMIIAEWPSSWPLGMAGIAGIWRYVVDQGLEATMMSWMVVLILWFLNVLGGADVKAIMTLMVLFPDSRLAWMLLLSGVMVSFLYAIRHHGKNLPRVLWATLGTIHRPVADDVTGKAPAMPVLALAWVTYLFVHIL